MSARLRNTTRLAAGATAIVLGAGLAASPATGEPKDPDAKIWSAGLDAGVPVEGLIVKFREGTAAASGDLSAAADTARRARSGLGLSAVQAMANRRVLLTTESAAPSREGMLEAMRALAADDRVELVEPNLRLTMPTATVNDPYGQYQWHYFEDKAGAGISQAWDQGASGAGATVAVLDTGITAHPEFEGRTVPGHDFVSDPWSARDGDGRDADPSDEGDWTALGECGTDGQGQPLPPRDLPSSWHGTHVAGTVAAGTGNGVGVAGVAPNAMLQPVRVLGRCGGTDADIADAIAWAAGAQIRGLPRNANPAQVLNLSLGGTQACPPVFEDALDFAFRAGATVVVAAGNSDAPASEATPANCVGPHITVAALGREGQKAGYSNFGPAVDISAPGGDMASSEYDGVFSTKNSGTTVPGEPVYAFSEGTSMATPHISGIAALLVAANPALSPEGIESILKRTSRPVPGACWAGCGSGLASAGQAVQAVATGATQ